MNPEGWIQDFFGSDNQWDFDLILNGEYPQKFQPHIEYVLQRALMGNLPNVLPMQGVDNRHYFYIMGSNIRQHRELIRVLEAHLGSVAVQFDPRVFVLSSKPFEVSLLEKFPHGFSTFSIPESLNTDSVSIYGVYEGIHDAVERYSSKPVSVSTLQRPIGRIMRDFIVACDRGDGDSSFDLYYEAAATENLSTINLISLELQVLAANASWQRILDFPKLPEILHGRISGVVSDLILSAVSNAILKSDNISDYDRDSLQISLSEIRPLFLRSPELSRSSSVTNWKTWGVCAVVCGYSRIFESLPEEIVGKKWIAQLAEWGGLVEPTTVPVNRIGLLADDEPSIENAVALLRMSAELNSLDEELIYRVLSGYPDHILDQLASSAGLNALWEQVKNHFETREDINDWSTWLEKISSGVKDNLDAQTIKESSRNWNSENWDEKKTLTQLFRLADSQYSSEFRNVIPVLLDWMRNTQTVVSANFIEQMILVLSVDDLFSVQDVALFSDLIELLTTTTHSQSQYEDSVAAAQDCWKKVKSVHSLNESLEQMEVLLDSPCASPPARVQYWNLVQDYCLASWKRLSITQQFVIHQISEKTLGSVSHLPELQSVVKDKAGSLAVDLRNKRLAIYTLTEGAGKRASIVLSNMFPGLQIVLNHDKSATKGLVNLASTADFFIFVSRSAAHQAFYPVIQRRDDILYPAGKGSSSIVRCFLDSILE